MCVSLYILVHMRVEERERGHLEESEAGPGGGGGCPFGWGGQGWSY